MDDVIYRQDAINAIGKHEVDRPGFHLNEYEEGFNSGLIIACEEIADLPSVGKAASTITIELKPEQIKKYVEQAITDIVPSAQQWIPCSERLPDQNGKYLVVGRQKAINILKFDGGRWYGKWGVVAWMPLPDCYQGDGNNEM